MGAEARIAPKEAQMHRSEHEMSGSIPKVHWVASTMFARYAESDLDRWRQIIGHQVIHNDARWGIGEVVAVSWGTCCDHVPSYVQIKIRYEGGWTTIGHSSTWHRHHQEVSVPAIVEAAIRECLQSDLAEDERAECLTRHARKLREQTDRNTLDHVEQMKRRVLDKRSVGTDSADGDQEANSEC